MANTERGSDSSSVVVLPETTVKDKFSLTPKGFDEICEAFSEAFKKIRREAIQPLPEDPNLHERS